MSLLFDKLQNLQQRIADLQAMGPCTLFNDFISAYLTLYMSFRDMYSSLLMGGCGFADIDAVIDIGRPYAMSDDADAATQSAKIAAALPCDSITSDTHRAYLQGDPNVLMDLSNPVLWGGAMMPLMAALSVFLLGCDCYSDALTTDPTPLDAGSVVFVDSAVRGSLPSLLLNLGTMVLASAGPNAPRTIVFTGWADVGAWVNSDIIPLFFLLELQSFKLGTCLNNWFAVTPPTASTAYTLSLGNDPFQNAWPSTQAIAYAQQQMATAWDLVKTYAVPATVGAGTGTLGQHGKYVRQAMAVMADVASTNTTLLGYFSNILTPGHDTSCQIVKGADRVTMCTFLQQERAVLRGLQRILALAQQAALMPSLVQEGPYTAFGSPTTLDFGAGVMTPEEAFTYAQWLSAIDDLFWDDGIVSDGSTSVTFASFLTVASITMRQLIASFQGLLEQPNPVCLCKGKRCCLGPIDDVVYENLLALFALPETQGISLF